MAELTVRKVDDELVRKLRMRAAKNGRSAEAEHRAILEKALTEGEIDFWAEAAKLRARLAGRPFGDSAELIREDRDRRSGLID